MGNQRWLEHRCRNEDWIFDGFRKRSCKVGIDPTTVRGRLNKEQQARLHAFPLSPPCVYGCQEGLHCDAYEPYTEMEKEAHEAQTAQTMVRFEAGLSPCCGEPVTKQEGSRTTVAHCSKCGAFAWRGCRRIGEP